MKATLTQEEFNQAEWDNPDNWSIIYFSKKDLRTTVPKRNQKHGSTINFGSPAGAQWPYYFFILFFLIGGILGAGLTFAILTII